MVISDFILQLSIWNSRGISVNFSLHVLSSVRRITCLKIIWILEEKLTVELSPGFFTFLEMRTPLKNTVKVVWGRMHICMAESLAVHLKLSQHC